MKNITLLIVMLLLTCCSSVILVDDWKNPEIDNYEPYKALVVGLTSNNKARQNFENKFKEELQLRGTEAVSSLTLFDSAFKTKKMTEDDLNSLENKLIEDGFDTVILSKVIGVENKLAYNKNYKEDDEVYKKFKDEYFMYQDIFYNPDYYQEYKVYHIETTMYCICPTKDKELIWKGYIDIVDPKSTDETINDYVNLVIMALEKHQLIASKTTLQKDTETTPIN
ncbi:hypothetical protein [Tenacibaculum caenipelagi]|uniref:Cardiolipin synthetase n=1 Tax=Tenacibaculum caenipelagi TaxID=1325435 RepID=A0A4R6TAN9_9FLAO|nr:hypothetical protein [Tenacibaculum caenipelagi]TDQ21959.1 hypothetical protein DFQ07_3056 [Tenacibaculum caenipelagi]